MHVLCRSFFDPVLRVTDGRFADSNDSAVVPQFPQLNALTLRADVIEKENEYEVHVDVPGVEKEDIDMRIVNGGLQVSAERKEKTEFSHRIERSYGRVSRLIPLPERANLATIDANFHNGVLSVTFAKTVPAGLEGVKLEIKSGHKPAASAASTNAV